MSKLLNSPIGVGVMCVIALGTLLKNTGALSALSSGNQSKPKAKKVVSAAAKPAASGAEPSTTGASNSQGVHSEDRTEFLKEELDRIATAKNSMFDPAERQTQEDEVDETIAAKDVLDLKATLLELRGSFAVINGRPMTVGESIEGFTIKEIGSGTVFLDGPGGPDSIYIWDE